MSNLALQDVVFDAVASNNVFYIIGDTVELFNSYTAYGWKTVAIYNKNYYYLGDNYLSLETAVHFWEQTTHTSLSAEEWDIVYEDNVGT